MRNDLSSTFTKGFDDDEFIYLQIIFLILALINLLLSRSYIALTLREIRVELEPSFSRGTMRPMA
jgi:hypothetical protein